MSLGSEYSHHLCRVCADICNACAEECEKHAQIGMQHYRECATACEEMATAAYHPRNAGNLNLYSFSLQLKQSLKNVKEPTFYYEN